MKVPTLVEGATAALTRGAGGRPSGVAGGAKITSCAYGTNGGGDGRLQPARGAAADGGAWDLCKLNPVYPQLESP